MKNFPALAAWRGPALALGLLIFRLHLGVVMVESGWPKMVPSEWFVNQVSDLGFTWPTPLLWAWVAAWGELVGGVLLILGLGTRWAAAQLTFQFFVIAFRWYDKPEFFTGMYVQQELFWGFVLLMATGAGAWSLDGWLRGRAWFSTRSAKAARQTVAAALVVLATFISGVPAFGSGMPSHLPINRGLARLALPGTGAAGSLRLQAEEAQTSAQPTPVPRLNSGELSDALAQWHGTLTYLDYGNQKTVTLRTTLRGEMSRPEQLMLRFDYEEPNKTHVFDTDTLQLSADGLRVKWDGVVYTVQAKQWLPNRTLSLVLEGKGQDDNRPATIRKHLLLSPASFSVQKEVRYAATTRFVQRNNYRFSR